MLEGVDVVPLARKGNGVVAKRDLAAGHVLVDATAWVALLDDPVFTCHWCFAEADPMGRPWKRCPACQAVRFCSDRCAAMPHACALAKALRVGVPDTDEDAEEITTVATLWDALHTAGREDRAQLALRLTTEGPVPLTAAKMARVAARVTTLLPHCPPLDGPTARELAAREMLNSFGIDSPMAPGESGEDGEPDVNYSGRLVCPEASFFNHSCDPNVRRCRVGRRMVFWAWRPIAQGEECCISYTSRGEERRQFLLEHYGFTCTCRHCVEHTNPRQEAALCTRCGCERWDGMCVVCDATQVLQALGL